MSRYRRHVPYRAQYREARRRRRVQWWQVIKAHLPRIDFGSEGWLP